MSESRSLILRSVGTLMISFDFKHPGLFNICFPVLSTRSLCFWNRRNTIFPHRKWNVIIFCSRELHLGLYLVVTSKPGGLSKCFPNAVRTVDIRMSQPPPWFDLIFAANFIWHNLIQVNSARTSTIWSLIQILVQIGCPCVHTRLRSNCNSLMMNLFKRISFAFQSKSVKSWI